MAPFSKKMYPYLILSALIVFGILFIDYGVLFKRIKLAGNDIIAMRKKLQFLEGQVQYYDVIKNESARVEEVRQRIVQAYPQPSSSLEFFYFLENAAQKTNNTIVTDTKEGKTPSFSVQLTGTFNDLIKFLFMLETLPIEIRLQQVSKQSPRGSSPPPRITSTLEIVPLAPLISQ